MSVKRFEVFFSQFKDRPMLYGRSISENHVFMFTMTDKTGKKDWRNLEIGEKTQYSALDWGLLSDVEIVRVS